MVFARQPSANKSKKTMNEILTFFQWHWDFKNVITLIISLVITLTYIFSNLKIFYKTYITGALLDDEHLNIILNQIFTLLETKPINVAFFTQTSNILAELSLYVNLF
jgi:hypothetical protein